MSDAAAVPVTQGCESVSHRGDTSVGVLIVHGFTGSPYSVRGLTDAMIAADHHVETPRLPGHGTTVDDLLRFRWDDWVGEVASAHGALAARTDHVVAVGQSMGGTLVLALALSRPELAGVVCINPPTRSRDAAVIEMIDELIEDGFEVAPGEGSDIADPDAHDISYDGTPLRPIRSLLVDGVASITDRFGEGLVPLRLFTSRQDHVVDPADSEHLATTWGALVEHTWLERGYHVATVDYDRTIVEHGTAAFVSAVTS